jgi:hypothetical protein
VQGPLAQFQATQLNKEDMHKLVKSMNSALAEKGLDVTMLDRVFDKWWDEFKDQTSKAIAQHSGPPDPSQKRSIQDILEEVLTLCRSMAQTAERKSQSEQEAAWRAWQHLLATQPELDHAIARTIISYSEAFQEAAKPFVPPKPSVPPKRAVPPKKTSD